MRQPKLIFCLVLLIVVGWLNGCANNQNESAVIFQYQFKPEKLYQLQAHYVSSHLLEKSHQGDVFSRQEDIVYVNATYDLKAYLIPENLFSVHYYLKQLSINDNHGKLRVEIGHHGGEISWFDEKFSLADYLGEQGLIKYQEVIKKPIANMVITPAGEQLPASEQSNMSSEINLELLELLSKNRVIGKQLINAFKIPPVLMLIYPGYELKPGDKWSYQKNDDTGQNKWQQALLTEFRYQGNDGQKAKIAYESRMDFSQKELNQLSELVIAKPAERMNFQKGQFIITGTALVDLKKMLPDQGEMKIEKDYSFDVEKEKWSSQDTEDYQFDLLVK